MHGYQALEEGFWTLRNVTEEFVSQLVKSHLFATCACLSLVNVNSTDLYCFTKRTGSSDLLHDGGVMHFALEIDSPGQLEVPGTTTLDDLMIKKTDI